MPTREREPAWDDAHLADPHGDPDKARRVRAMFAAIAPKYDLNNRLHSLGRDRAWRRVAVEMAEVRPGDRVLDVACGTGDLAIVFRDELLEAKFEKRIPRSGPVAKHDAPVRIVIGLDFTFEMLPLAVAKSDPFPGWDPVEADEQNFFHGLTFVHGDAMRLPFADASFDIVSIAFGLRNVADPAAALAEFHRVLRPGGRVIVLEFTVPSNPLMRWINAVYCGRIMPRTATWIAGDTSGAYRYLPRSVNTFADRETLMRSLGGAGFVDAVSRSLSFGIAACYRGVKP